MSSSFLFLSDPLSKIPLNTPQFVTFQTHSRTPPLSKSHHTPRPPPNTLTYLASLQTPRYPPNNLTHLVSLPTRSDIPLPSKGHHKPRHPPNKLTLLFFKGSLFLSNLLIFVLSNKLISFVISRLPFTCVFLLY